MLISTQRRRRAAAALALILALVCGLAYATSRDGGSPSAADPFSPGTALSAGPAGAPGAPGATALDASDAPGASPAPETPGRDGFETASPTPRPGVVLRSPGEPSFTVSGSPAREFSPEVSQPVDLSISNPNSFDLTVTAVTVHVGQAQTADGQPIPGCADGNLIVTREFSGTVVVPAHVTSSLSGLGVDPSQWPVLTMPDTLSNQDACQQATFPLTYNGTGSTTS